ncbi:uncharacterized protein BDZ99DRAFT_523783 [Mytilinidion resinicola]|uniref:Protein kinase domain-containing protein n=1 Tax=Mytilinidion resinicola TaxID=574789 RepID=A0A6A6YE19_9PEZI|nr:uncharacterized protein BDZ99DRAFT_523783 [Mytilinidion resinicola]KAF2806325.1 hypothetical protein BDZ99DRAFT_523783 [Mytilinidion resinicola]
MPISLDHIANRPGLNEMRLAAILGQIMNGISKQRLEHSSLTCSNILANPDRDVKIADYKCCQFRPSEKAEPRDIRALSYITMELMQGYAKGDGAVGVDDPGRWNSDAVSVLSATTSATSVDELMKHP